MAVEHSASLHQCTRMCRVGVLQHLSSQPVPRLRSSKLAADRRCHKGFRSSDAQMDVPILGLLRGSGSLTSLFGLARFGLSLPMLDSASRGPRVCECALCRLRRTVQTSRVRVGVGVWVCGCGWVGVCVCVSVCLAVCLSACLQI